VELKNNVIQEEWQCDPVSWQDYKPGGVAPSTKTEEVMSNLFSGLPNKLPKELVTVLAENKHIRIERIVSTGHASPEGFWYDQDEHEWVVVLKGETRLLFENGEPVQMTPGDYVNIPSHHKHRVEWTTPDEPTVWLALFYKDQTASRDAT
jgi:cupin 2 domain-containing protein